MKIACIVFNTYIHDARVQRTAEALNEKYSVKVYGLNDYKVSENGYLNEVEYELIGLRSKQFSFGKIALFLKFIEYFFRTLHKLCKYKPDIIHVNNVHTLIFGYVFHLFGKKVIYDSHELWIDTQDKFSSHFSLIKILVRLEKKFIKKTSQAITVCNNISIELGRLYNIKNPIVIYNISNVPKNVHNEDIIREKLNMGSNEKIILFVGGLSNGRGLANLIHSCLYWNDDIKLVFLGSGVLHDVLLEMVNKLNLHDKVFFLAPVPQDQVLMYVKSCDAGIIPYENTCLNHYYALPNKLFQYAQMKVPILASNFPEMSKLISDYNLGYTFDPHNPSAIAEAVNNMFDSKFSISGRDYISFVHDFNWDNEKKKLLQIYRDLE